jgi:hypothetical protein
MRSEQAIKLHHTFFETLPGFTWINISSVLLGVVYFFVFSWIFAAYMVWMHNKSLIKPEK